MTQNWPWGALRLKSRSAWVPSGKVTERWLISIAGDVSAAELVAAESVAAELVEGGCIDRNRAQRCAERRMISAFISSVTRASLAAARANSFSEKSAL